MNSVDMANDLINRAKNLKLFEIERDISDNGILFNGAVPFDIRATQETAWFKVYAVTQEEAEAQVDNWLSWRI
jgi:hypothetical protein